MICYALLAALALLGLGEARSAGGPTPKYHLPLASRMVSFRTNHLEPVRQSSVYLVGKIGVGTPPQELDVLFDLGSSEIIVPSTNSTTNQCEDGQLTIGGWDESLVSEDQITWIDHAKSNDYIYWGFPVVYGVSADIGGEKTSLGSMPGGLMVDSGNPSFLTLPYEIYKAYEELFSQYGQVGGDPHAIELVEELSGIDEKLPTLNFDFQGLEVALKPSQYIMTHDDNPDITPGYGMIAIACGRGRPFAGGIFLRNFYTIFDMENQRMGLVPVSEISS